MFNAVVWIGNLYVYKMKRDWAEGPMIFSSVILGVAFVADLIAYMIQQSHH